MTPRLTFLLSTAALIYERVWSSFWPAFTIVCAYSGLALMNVVGIFGPKAHAALLMLTACALLFALLRPFRFPRRQDVERRMEEASALPHRPLAALRDAPAGEVRGDTRALWDKHVRRMAGLTGALKMCRPRPDAARQDCYGLRFAATGLLVMGLIIAGADAGPRLVHGVTPAVSFAFMTEKTALDVWIAPPEYTRLPPVFLAASQHGVATAGTSVAVPARSVLKVRLDGGARPPRLRFGGVPHAFSRASEKSWILALPLSASGTLRLRQGLRERGVWNILAVADTPPEIEITSAEPAPRGRLKIVYTARDDYGVVKISGALQHAAPDDAVAAFGMPAPSPDKAENSFTVDLSSDLRAGKEARLVLTATDAVGNSAAGAPFPLILPERAFTHPLARKLAAARKKLVAEKDAAARKAVAHEIADLGQDLAAYDGDIVVFLSLGSVVRRLLYDSRPEAVSSVVDLLWDVALKIEDGGLSVAARDLSEALQQLAQALGDKDTPPPELQKQLAELQRKMQTYLQQLATQMLERLKDGKSTAPLPRALAKKFMQHIDLGELLRQMQALSNGGSREDMKRLAEILKDTVGSLSLDKMGQTSPEQAEAMKALEALSEIIKDQQLLMEKTGRLDPKDKGAEEKKGQDALRAQLGDAARRLGEGMKTVPENLAKADRSMKESQKAFRNGAPRHSIPHQKEALAELQKGLDGAVKQIAQDMQQVMLSFGFSPGGTTEGYGAGFDPLGRRNEGGGKAGGDMTVPDDAERRRVREIVDEIRKRSNDTQRPRVERDYLDRLLDQMN